MLAYSTLRQPLYQRGDTATDVAWTAVYLGNWHFMGANSYFNDDGVPRILLHMWSLAVEEQFYLAWPLVITAAALLAGGKLRRVLLWLTVALIVVSALLLAFLYDPAAPDRAYMGTDSKAFEPLLGAGLAIVLAGTRGRALFAARPRLTAAVGIVLAGAALPFLGGPSDAYFRGEQPIRRGRLGAWLTPRRLVVAVAVVMVVVLGWSSALRATHGIGPATRVIIATGDSVPMKMMTPLDRAATARGWAIDSAARGGCTPLAIEMQQYLKPPHEGAGDCRGVRPIQDALIDRYDPEIVFWWFPLRVASALARRARRRAMGGGVLGGARG